MTRVNVPEVPKNNIRTIMEIAGEIFYINKKTLDTSIGDEPISCVYITGGYYAAIIKGQGLYRLALYDFEESHKPFLIVGEECYHPMAPGKDSEFFLPLVKAAKSSFFKLLPEHLQFPVIVPPVVGDITQLPKMFDNPTKTNELQHYTEVHNQIIHNLSFVHMIVLKKNNGNKFSGAICSLYGVAVSQTYKGDNWEILLDVKDPDGKSTKITCDGSRVSYSTFANNVVDLEVLLQFVSDVRTLVENLYGDAKYPVTGFGVYPPTGIVY